MCTISHDVTQVTISLYWWNRFALSIQNQGAVTAYKNNNGMHHKIKSIGP